MQALLSAALIDAGGWIDRQGWCPATGGNFSARLDGERALVTASGRHKGRLIMEDLLTVDLQGSPVDSDLKPSAETLLHTRLYQLDKQIGAVLHTHSVASTVLSRMVTGEWLTISGYEMQKSLAGNTSHEPAIQLAVFDNTQDMQSLAAQLAARWQQSPLSWGFLVRGHGLYAWGKDIAEARRHLEGLEFLFACELEMRRLAVK
ncbi:methylthioribulose 1-phosphate dehydratase [Amphritea sp. 2_MG-2023]|uniref:methylthioribulose 1-phosphate dehydratase n=1 Tax=Amphritea TaxID=515417 RepID=UPI001C072D56|nr:MULTISPECIES: methylthioribulose 1-phosphate dehydratase [Amphritea]MBU2966072.1 methylthioribulose 1-phosphate dehydratase [Amphritea atlantica]MDO6418162.1 methylthioribulose 1-phosphate dehydratase [Amphritea sp. 2_MG-2023]